MMNTKIYLLFLACALLAAGNAQADEVRRLTQSEAMKLALAKPQPEYPGVAKQLKLEGRVEVEASIGQDGSVESVKILTGNAVLTNSAASAMRRWKFQPVQDGGKPVKAIATLSFTFKL